MHPKSTLAILLLACCVSCGSRQSAPHLPSEGNPDPVGEALFADARAAGERADAAPNDVALQQAAFDAIVKAYAYDWPGVMPDHSATWLAVRASVDRITSATPDCAIRMQSATLYDQSLEFGREAALFAGPARDCITPNDIAKVVGVLGAPRCDASLALASHLFAMAPPEQEVPILDRVVACSDAYTVRTNLAFVPPEKLADYEALVQQRQHDQAAAAQAQALARSQDECESECLTYYGEGGVCAKSCGMDIPCSSNCAPLGTACIERCKH